MDVKFSPNYSWDTVREAIVFHATVGQAPLRCVVSMEFLTAPFTRFIGDEEAGQLFDAKQDEIHSLFRARIEQADYDPAKELILTTD